MPKTQRICEGLPGRARARPRVRTRLVCYARGPTTRARREHGMPKRESGGTGGKLTAARMTARARSERSSKVSRARWARLGPEARKRALAYLNGPRVKLLAAPTIRLAQCLVDGSEAVSACERCGALEALPYLSD